MATGSFRVALACALGCFAVVALLRRRSSELRDRVGRSRIKNSFVLRSEWLARIIFALGLLLLAEAAIWNQPADGMPSFSTKETRVVAGGGLKEPPSHVIPGSIFRWGKCSNLNYLVTSYVVPIILAGLFSAQVDAAILHRFPARRARRNLRFAAHSLWIVTSPMRFDRYWGETKPHCTSVCGPSTIFNGRPKVLSSLAVYCADGRDDCAARANLTLCARDELVWGDFDFHHHHHRNNSKSLYGQSFFWMILIGLALSLPLLAMRPLRTRGTVYFGVFNLLSTTIAAVRPWTWCSTLCITTAVCFSFMAIALDGGASEHEDEEKMLLLVQERPDGKSTSGSTSAASRQRLSTKLKRRLADLASLLRLSRSQTLIMLLTGLGLLISHIFFANNHKVPQFIVNALMLYRPVKESAEAIRTESRGDDTKWLLFWIVYAAYALLESALLNWLVRVFPFWWAFKIGFLAWLQDRETNGATTLYLNLLSPFVKSYSVTPSE